MKIPTSSSILLATVAISSSSSCLAAPAGMPTSTSTSHIYAPTASATSDYHPGERIVEEGSDVLLERSEYSSLLEKRDASLTGEIIQVINGLPVVGPPLAKIVSPVLAVQGPAGAQSNDSSASGQNINPQDMAALQASIQEVSRVLNSTFSNLPPPIQSIGGAVTSALPVPTPGALSEGDDPNSDAGSSGFVSSGTPGPTQAAEAVDGQSSASSTASAAPSSPPMPGNPPNTPSLSLPVGNSGSLPVNV